MEECSMKGSVWKRRFIPAGYEVSKVPTKADCGSPIVMKQDSPAKGSQQSCPLHASTVPKLPAQHLPLSSPAQISLEEQQSAYPPAPGPQLTGQQELLAAQARMPLLCRM
jgi:hypothetical protein